MDNSESKWLVQAIEGDSDAFASLIERYQQPVFNLCYRMLGNANDAEDASQETFLRAYKALHRYDLNRSFLTWILSIASHYCIDQIRKRRFTTYSIDNEETPWIEPRDPLPTPEAVLGISEREKHVKELLNDLSPKDRAAVVLRYWYDYSYDEIAETLSLTNSAVKSRLHRARKDLAKLWMIREKQMAAKERKQNESPVF